ncbi:MAG: hypothetical protein GHCLOJNM_02919 [bacterium]|nr:hypothetical protein [bacterium]
MKSTFSPLTILLASITIWLVLLHAGESGCAEVKPMGSLALEPPKGIRYSLDGMVGERVQANLENWLLRAPLANPGMLEMFRVRDRKPVPQLVPWAGEFVGKYLISAIQARRMVEDPRLEAILREVIGDLIGSQDEDGYLGPFPKDQRLLGNWDLWGHYHAITALLLWHEDTGDEAAKLAAIRAGDLVCATYLDTDRRPLQAGSDEMNLSILTAMGRLHRHTGDDRYLRMMKVVEEDWEKAGDYFRQGLAGIDFYRIPRPRWESLHDLQGLVELYRITGNEDYKTAFVNLWRSIAKFDRHNTGGFSTGEQAIGNPYTPGAIETCCTTAWAALSTDMLQLSGESVAADELELSLFNSILGSQHPSGRWWTYNTPMDGKREASAHTIVFQSRAGTPELNCCSVNAPRGLGVISEWGILKDSDGALVVNYYGPMRAALDLSPDLHVEIEQVTDYPVDGRIVVVVHPSRPGAAGFPIRLRIPKWSRKTTITSEGFTVDEKIIEAARSGAGNGKGYVTLAREWKDGDRIEIHLDLSLRSWVGDGAAAGKVSIYRGPILLAFDQRDNPYDCPDLPALNYSDIAALKGVSPEPSDKFPPMALVEGKGTDDRTVRLRDFATAGAAGTEYLSWLPVENAPPPLFHPLEPRDGASIPKGPVKFTWTGNRVSESARYVLEVAEEPEFKQVVLASEPTHRSAFVLREEFEPGKTYFWRVTASNPHGAQVSEGPARSFQIDPALPNTFIDHPALVDFREDGLVASSALDGDGSPIFGYLEEARNVRPAPDRAGKEGGAVRFSGDGMLRYRVPYFPTDRLTFAAWFRADELPEGRLAQVMSAWARGGDDPLRVVIENGRLFARIEGGGGAGTQGFPIEAGTWFHVAAVKNGASLALFVDGKKVNETFAPANIPSTVAEDFALGANPHHVGNEFFIGAMDDFALYAKPLSVEEIEGLYRGNR